MLINSYFLVIFSYSEHFFFHSLVPILTSLYVIKDYGHSFRAINGYFCRLKNIEEFQHNVFGFFGYRKCFDIYFVCSWRRRQLRRCIRKACGVQHHQRTHTHIRFCIIVHYNITYTRKKAVRITIDICRKVQFLPENKNY